MTLVHIVLFEFKPNASKEVIDDICKNMLSLAEQCVHPETKKPYILSASGGRDCSPEGHQGGFSHGFVSHFATASDRDYYLNSDEAHLAFVKKIGPVVQNVRVVDYEMGVF
ncbi:stress responsive A B barrel domain-containing protein [Rutstroemia sp. NJR-2017a WRK4]|nr:stress responsive A B barrel domain-containing protein [Rutstroemia sp. NJR-2017a WRK4]